MYVNLFYKACRSKKNEKNIFFFWVGVGGGAGVEKKGGRG